MTKQDIVLASGSAISCTVAVEQDGWMIAVDDSGHEHVAKHNGDTWYAVPLIEMLESLKWNADEIAALTETLAQAYATIFFNSNAETEHRIRNKTPELERRAEFDALEKEAIVRHLARLQEKMG